MADIDLRQRPKPSWWRRAISAARQSVAPHRKTETYARLSQVGGWSIKKNKPLIKPVAANLRYFARTPYASRAIQMYVAPLSMLNWRVQPKKDVKDNPEIKRQMEVVQNCLMKPNHDDSWTTLLQQLVEDILVGGAGVLEQQIGTDAARPLWLWPVDVLSIQIYAGWDGETTTPRYMQTFGYGNIGVGQYRDLLNRDLIYMKERPTTDTPFAYGKLEIAFETINRLLGVAEFAGDVAANANPENVIFIKSASKEEIEAFRGYWRDEIEGQGNVPVIGGEDIKIAPLRGSKDDNLFLKYQQFIVREIATAMGCSPQNFGVDQDVNRNQGEVAEDRDWDLSIKPMARMIAAYITREAIEARLGHSQIELSPGGLDRMDELATSKIYSEYYKGNAITPNEQRARMNPPLPPLTGGWGDLVFADVEIAIQGARGSATENPDLATKE